MATHSARKVVVCYDSDVTDPNKTVGAAECRLGKALRGNGIKNPRCIRIPSGPKNQKHGADDFIVANGKAAFDQLLKDAQPIADQREEEEGELVMINAEDLKPENVEWMLPDRIPLSKCAALTGDQSQGKTTIAIGWAAQLSKAGVVTLYMSNENDYTTDVMPRWLAAGGKPGHLIIIDAVQNGAGRKRGFKYEDAEILRKAILEAKKIKGMKAVLVIFDPVQSYFGKNTDMHKANQTRDQLDYMSRLAREEKASMLFICHRPKTPPDRAVNVSLGSVDIGALMRQTMLVGSPANQPDVHVLLTPKPAGKPKPAVSYVIESVMLKQKDSKGKDIDAPRVKWTGDSTLTYADICEPENKMKAKDTEEGPVQRTTRWLRENLPLNEPVTLQDILEGSGADRRNMSDALKAIRHKKGKDEDGNDIITYLGRGKFAAKIRAAE